MNDIYLRIDELKKMAGRISDMVEKSLATKGKKINFKSLGVSLGPGTSVFMPENPIKSDGSVDITFFFRGGSPSLMSKAGANTVTVFADAGGTGGGPSRKAYGYPDFVNRGVGTILSALKNKTGKDVKLGKLVFAGWSGGYDPIHGIIEGSQQGAKLVKDPDAVVLLDGMHHPLDKGRTKAMEVWDRLAEKAQKGDTKFIVAHSAVNPGIYSSTTQTADWLLNKRQMKRNPTQSWDGETIKPKSIASSGNFKVYQLHDKELPYMAYDPRTGKHRPNVPGTAGRQHIEAREFGVDALREIFN